MDVGMAGTQSKLGIDARRQRIWMRRPMGHGPDTDQMRGYASRLRSINRWWVVSQSDMQDFGTPDFVMRRLINEAESLASGRAGPELHLAKEFMVGYRQSYNARSRFSLEGRLASLGPTTMILNLCDILDHLRGTPPLVDPLDERLEKALDEGGLTLILVDEAVAAIRELRDAMAEATRMLDEAGTLLGAFPSPGKGMHSTVLAVRGAAERARGALALVGPYRRMPTAPEDGDDAVDAVP